MSFRYVSELAHTLSVIFITVGLDPFPGHSLSRIDQRVSIHIDARDSETTATGAAEPTDCCR